MLTALRGMNGMKVSPDLMRPCDAIEQRLALACVQSRGPGGVTYSRLRPRSGPPEARNHVHQGLSRKQQHDAQPPRVRSRTPARMDQQVSKTGSPTRLQETPVEQAQTQP